MPSSEWTARRRRPCSIKLFGSYQITTALREVILPHLREVGERWARGEISIAHEHFGSHIIRERLVSLGRSWGRGSGPRALLACLEDELHDLPLIAFGLALRDEGWSISFLGSNTPAESVLEVVRERPPTVAVISATRPGPVHAAREVLRDLSGVTNLVVAGSPECESIAAEIGATYIDGDPGDAAATIDSRFARTDR